jgi:hypothetical protein
VFNPRSPLPLAANFGDRQVTKRKELACRYHRVGMATNFNVGLRATRVTLWQATVRIGAFKMFSRPNFCWAHYEGTSDKLRRGVKRALIPGGHMIGYCAVLPPRHAGGADRHTGSRWPFRRRTDNHCPEV